jgi:Zn ribbon nucleic-acid-binding protein
MTIKTDIVKTVTCDFCKQSVAKYLGVDKDEATRRSILDGWKRFRDGNMCPTCYAIKSGSKEGRS